MVKRSYDCKEATGTFFVIIKLDPMATVPDTARARPTYLSSTMKKYVGGEGGWLGGWGRAGYGKCGWIAAAVTARQSGQGQTINSRTLLI